MAKRQKTNSNLLEVQNAAKTMFANIRFQSIDKQIQSILLTSTVPDEGKTTTAWYLAQAMATAGNRVLMVEADMRRRSLANMLQLHPRNGLFAVLTGAAQLNDAVTPTSVKNLFFLDAEPSIPNPPDLLASKRMTRFNEMLCEAYDYVIYDTPPVGTFVDAAVLGTVVDGVILVVRPGQPKRTELQQAHSQLVNAGANIIGLCTTFVEGTGSEYYYSYYTKGGRSKGNDGKDMAFTLDPEEAAAAESLPASVTRGDRSSRHERRAATSERKSGGSGSGSSGASGGSGTSAKREGAKSSAKQSAKQSGKQSARQSQSGQQAARQGGEAASQAAQPAQSWGGDAFDKGGWSGSAAGGQDAPARNISVPRGAPLKSRAGKSGIVQNSSSYETVHIRGK